MADKAQIFSDVGLLKDLFAVIPHFVDLHPNFWLQIRQTDKAKESYGATYSINTFLHDENLTLIPQSGKVQTVLCYAFQDGK